VFLLGDARAAKYRIAAARLGVATCLGFSVSRATVHVLERGEPSSRAIVFFVNAWILHGGTAKRIESFIASCKKLLFLPCRFARAGVVQVSADGERDR
jgi:hypothetical protein